MELGQLSAFVAVSHQGSFSAASTALHLTQPAVSKRVAQLEASLGVQLLDRIGRQVLLTEAGQTLLPRAQRLLRDAEAAQQALQELQHAISGPLRIASSHHIGLHRLPPVLRQFHALYPQVALDIQFLDSEQAWQGVARGTIELALTTLAPEADAHTLTAIELWDDPLSFVMAPSHPLASRKKLQLRDLSQHPAILPEAGTFTHRIVAEAFAERGLPLQLRMATLNMETLKMLTAVGLAWSVLPQTMLDDQLKAVAISEVQLKRKLGCIMHGKRTLSRAAQAFLGLLRQSV